MFCKPRWNGGSLNKCMKDEVRHTEGDVEFYIGYRVWT